MEIIYLVIGVAAGIAVGYLVLRNQSASKLSDLLSQKSVAEQKANDLFSQKEKLENDSAVNQQKILSLTSELSTAKNQLENLGEKLANQKQEIEELQEKFTTEFKNIANELLEEKSKKFTEQNKINLDEILNPLKEKIKDFERKVEDTHKESIKDSASLKQQLEMLQKLNQTIGEEAKNLTSALKGQSKTMGNWGEMILESILEKSGLVRDREYIVQQSLTTEAGKRFQPDVIIHLPDKKDLVIDSKVSLTAYENYCSTDIEEERKRYLTDHMNSMRRHVKDLSGKNYQQLYQLKSLDFVLMFIPIEPAYALAAQSGIDIWSEAFEKNIVIVTTSTLLATLKTVSSIWRQERQNKNAEEIARQGADLYDKLVGFIDDLLSLGRKLDDAKKSYEESMKKLSTGTGNLVKRAEKMKELGLKSTKSLPQSLIDRAEE